MGQFSPSCNCCEVTCNVANSGSGFTTLVGTWDTSGTGEATIYVTAGANSYVYTNSVSMNFWRARVSIQLTLTGDPGSEHFIVRLIGGASDTNNYTYIEYEFRNDGGAECGGGFWNSCDIAMQYRMGKVIAGTPTVLTVQPYTLTAHSGYPSWNYNADNNPATKTIELELCWDGTTLTGNGHITGTGNADGWGHSRNRLMASTDVTPAGDIAAFGVGGTLSGFDDVSFFDFFLDHILDETHDCEECPVHCCGSPPPGTVTVAISGTMADATWSRFGNSCTIDCQDLVGTYVLDINSDLGPLFAGDDSCLWILNVTAAVGADCTIDGFSMRDLKLTATIDASGLLQVIANLPFENLNLGVWNDDAVFGCDWTDVELAPDAEGVDGATFDYQCQISTITVSSA